MTAAQLYNQGRDAMAEGDLPRAIALFAESAREVPHFKTYELLGGCLLRQGQLRDAILYLSAAAGLGQRQSRSRYLLAQALEARGDAVHAIQKLDEALAAQPSYRSARELRDQYLAAHPRAAAHLADPAAEDGAPSDVRPSPSIPIAEPFPMPRPLVAYVDIDDTLIRSVGTRRMPIPAAVQHVRELHAQQAALYCWSSGGARYARESAAEVGVEECFVAFLPKPDVLLDDQAVGEWRRLLNVHPAECQGQSVDSYRERLRPVRP